MRITYQTQLQKLMQDVLKTIYDLAKGKDPIVFFMYVDLEAEDLPTQFINDTIEFAHSNGFEGNNFWYLYGIEDSGSLLNILGIDDGMNVEKIELESLSDDTICAIADFMRQRDLENSVLYKNRFKIL